MPINYEVYKQKALEAVKEVFVKEYKNSIGIPMPKIEFIFPDDDNYKTGQYYISIDETWQIHLNFGLLPISYKDYQEEVRVLTRHEVGHYMCCPFDVITHFRMLKVIIETFNNCYVKKYPLIDIIQLAGSLANQAADIIVDTVNFGRNKQETLKSEINWIKKGTDFQKIPRHSKLMFLVKGALWKENLSLNESDGELLTEVKKLSEQFEENGVENRANFLEKAEAYTHSFFKLFEQDQQEQERKQQQEKGSENNSSSSQISTNEHSAQEQSDNSDRGQPQASPSKDSHQNGSQFVFQSPDKIQEALAELAQETSIQTFNQILSASGFKSLSDKEKEKLWFEAQSVEMIPIEETSLIGSNDDYSYPTSWKLGDPIEDIDMMLTFSTSPIFIPGVTTKKWEKNSIFNFGNEKKQLDLLLVIDTSGSMGDVRVSSSNMHQAVLVSYGIINFFESTKSQVALIGFSDKITANIEWTKKYDEVREKLLVSGNGGTSFPNNSIQRTLEDSNNEIVTVVVTDGEINNLKQTVDYFKDYLNAGNKLFIFLQNRKVQISSEYEILMNSGAKIIKGLTANEMCNTVLNEINED